jgi:hypothetical protein
MGPTLLHVAENSALAEMLKDLLVQEGIEATVVASVHPLGWHADNRTEVWITDETDLDKARSIADEFAKGSTGTRGWKWRCPTCGEQIEPQFTACWRCGASKA